MLKNTTPRIHVDVSLTSYMVRKVNVNLVQVWVHVLALKVQESVHFALPFLEYVFALVRVNSYQNKNMHHMFYFWVRVLRQAFT